MVGAALGETLGFAEGGELRISDGEVDGTVVGALVGDIVGLTVGTTLGIALGVGDDGFTVGDEDGLYGDVIMTTLPAHELIVPPL